MTNAFKHGHTTGPRGSTKPSPTYNSWRAMIERCTREAHPRYPDYGGRGIRVSEAWTGRGGFARFLAWMGERPDGLTLDRKNPDGHYEPGNVRWATIGQQRWNRRDMVERCEEPPDEATVVVALGAVEVCDTSQSLVRQPPYRHTEAMSNQSRGSTA